MAKLEKRATVTAKGQVVIPIDMRRALGIEDGAPVVFTLEEGFLTLRLLRPSAKI